MGIAGVSQSLRSALNTGAPCREQQTLISRHVISLTSGCIYFPELPSYVVFINLGFFFYPCLHQAHREAALIQKPRCTCCTAQNQDKASQHRWQESQAHPSTALALRSVLSITQLCLLHGLPSCQHHILQGRMMPRQGRREAEQPQTVSQAEGPTRQRLGKGCVCAAEAEVMVSIQ